MNFSKLFRSFVFYSSFILTADFARSATLDDELHAELEAAVFEGSLERVEKMLSEVSPDRVRAVLSHTNSSGNTLLHTTAMVDRRTAIGRKLFSLCPECMTIQNPLNGNTPLMIASRSLAWDGVFLSELVEVLPPQKLLLRNEKGESFLTLTKRDDAFRRDVHQRIAKRTKGLESPPVFVVPGNRASQTKELPLVSNVVFNPDAVVAAAWRNDVLEIVKFNPTYGRKEGHELGADYKQMAWRLIGKKTYHPFEKGGESERISGGAFSGSYHLRFKDATGEKSLQVNANNDRLVFQNGETLSAVDSEALAQINASVLDLRRDVAPYGSAGTKACGVLLQYRSK